MEAVPRGVADRGESMIKNSRADVVEEVGRV